MVFRIYAPKASEVTLTGDFVTQGRGTAGPMQKGDDGVWSLTVGPLVPDFYSYSFNVDGVRTIDPRNPMVKQGVASLDSMFLVPGPEAAYEDMQPRAARRNPRRLVRLQDAGRTAPHARLHAAGIRTRQHEISRALPHARRRRRGFGLEHHRPRGVHPG